MSNRTFALLVATAAAIIAVAWWRAEAPVNQYARYVKYHRRNA